LQLALLHKAVATTRPRSPAQQPWGKTFAQPNADFGFLAIRSRLQRPWPEHEFGQDARAVAASPSTIKVAVRMVNRFRVGKRPFGFAIKRARTQPSSALQNVQNSQPALLQTVIALLNGLSRC
jgi:hypothetical protein